MTRAFLLTYAFGRFVEKTDTEQIANTGVCSIRCADGSERGDSTHDASAGYIVAFKSRELLVGTVRCRVGRFMECMRAHHAIIPGANDSRAD